MILGPLMHLGPFSLKAPHTNYLRASDVIMDIGASKSCQLKNHECFRNVCVFLPVGVERGARKALYVGARVCGGVSEGRPWIDLFN